MNQLEIIRFPFLGARENGEPFEYLLLDINRERANLAIFNWMVNFVNLEDQERVNLFIPNALTVIYQFRNNNLGTVRSIKKEENGESFIYEVAFNGESPLAFSANSPQALAQQLPSDFSVLEMLIQLIKDSLILKQGILVYLKHLAPYFSRIVEYSHKRYRDLEKFIFDDIKNRIKANEAGLSTLYLSLKDLKDPNDIPIALNLEHLRENIESEISLDLFLVAFAKDDSRNNLMELLKESKYQDRLKFTSFYMNYLISIKELEKRLYSNYNQIVLLYLKSI